MIEMHCAICMVKFRGHGHMGWPLTNGVVCDSCNRTVVITRMGEIALREQMNKLKEDEEG